MVMRPVLRKINELMNARICHFAAYGLNTASTQ